MRADMVRWFIVATLGVDKDIVFYGNQPDKPDYCITVYSEPLERVSVHTGVHLIPYQAVLRVATDTALSIAEALARTILEAVRSNHNLKVYDGMYLTAVMSGTTDPITFDPDDGSGNSTATSFNTNDYILIDNEILKVTGVAGSTVTATREQLDTTKAAHSNNDEVFNITKNPVPGETCMSTMADGGINPLGLDDKLRREFGINWTARVKP